MLNFSSKPLLDCLANSGWKPGRLVKLPQNFLSLPMSAIQMKILKNLSGLELEFGRGRKGYFYFSDLPADPRFASPYQAFFEVVDELYQEGYEIPENLVPLFHTNFDQFQGSYGIDQDGNLYSFGEEIIKIKKGLEYELERYIKMWS